MSRVCSRASTTLLLAASALWAAAGCADVQLEQARGHVRAGRLERAAAVLEGRHGREADALRGELARRTSQRAALRADLEAMRLAREAGREDRTRDELRRALDALLARARDPLEREWVEVEMSRAEDSIAEREQGGTHPKVFLPGLGMATEEPASVAPVKAPRDPLLELVIADIRDAIDQSRWWRAMIVADMALEDAPRAAPRLLALRDQALERASAEAVELLARARALEDEEGAAAAHALLAQELWRFPDEGLAARVHRASDELRVELLRARPGVGKPDARVDPGADPDDPLGPAASAETPATKPALQGGASAEVRAELERLASSVLDGAGASREAAWAELTARADGDVLAKSLLQETLETLAERVADSLRGDRTLARLERLAERRVELDRLRVHALELIFDEQEYFYPFEAPAVPASRSTEYLEVQREVDRRVQAVRDLWAASATIDLGRSFRRALSELHWTSTRAGSGSASLAELPEWVGGIDPDLEAIGLQSFAWSSSGRERLARSRAVLALNEHRWAVKSVQPGAPSPQERDQVRLTNDYRVMMGRGALAWSPLLQESARMHSQYQSETGHFGHYEELPGRRAPFDRMKLVGYDGGASENVYAGFGAAGAHASWIHSSAHHRNLLNSTVTEMASAVVDQYWTQNMGSGTAFESELQAWQD